MGKFPNTLFSLHAFRRWLNSFGHLVLFKRNNPTTIGYIGYAVGVRWRSLEM